MTSKPPLRMRNGQPDRIAISQDAAHVELNDPFSPCTCNAAAPPIIRLESGCLIRNPSHVLIRDIYAAPVDALSTYMGTKAHHQRLTRQSYAVLVQYLFERDVDASIRDELIAGWIDTKMLEALAGFPPVRRAKVNGLVGEKELGVEVLEEMQSMVAEKVLSELVKRDAGTDEKRERNVEVRRNEAESHRAPTSCVDVLESDAIKRAKRESAGIEEAGGKGAGRKWAAPTPKRGADSHSTSANRIDAPVLTQTSTRVPPALARQARVMAQTRPSKPKLIPQEESSGVKGAAHGIKPELQSMPRRQSVLHAQSIALSRVDHRSDVELDKAKQHARGWRRVTTNFLLNILGFTGMGMALVFEVEYLLRYFEL